jgi:hypothetical protein
VLFDEAAVLGYRQPNLLSSGLRVILAQFGWY